MSTRESLVVCSPQMVTAAAAGVVRKAHIQSKKITRMTLQEPGRSEISVSVIKATQ
jgi:hypothetical protein